MPDHGDDDGERLLTLGHSAIAVTMNTYSHVLPSLQRDAADRINDLLA